ncbi:MAG: YicC family protein [Puniceicoccales bacterium]|jgi:uncharacterized protein (TIGR00255 family)|nr:YicC family protein [Puniceicoccales bacterium]
MPIKSMTGYGRATLTLGATEMTLEASTVNRRTLELHISAPPEWTTLEHLLAPCIRAHITRGKLTLQIQPSLTANATANALLWDPDALRETLAKLSRQAAAHNLPFNPDAHLLLRLAELHRARRENLPPLDAPGTQSALKAALHTALSHLAAMRAQEGRHLETDLRARIHTLQTHTTQITTHSDGILPRHRTALFARLQQAGLDLDPADERVLKEIALFADRCDITEETTRLHSHYAQFLAILDEAQEIGRKLDFLCQEINRELNTIGSKANHLPITRLVIEGKNELERIREQVQNIE